ncbi:Arsenical resistance operon repressor (plasmid) [Klebsiella pneumoniae 30660/NJST258_1]|nr:Arsenical resistance operon repressor [Klebsiella pneumoniae 30660/NJST258_1]ARR90211.1 Arsenical resistance operon repressor [Klebsiella pneumoniae]ARR90321.1 Arsenical resistance operon repressor [Klebsiella pneumoniae]
MTASSDTFTHSIFRIYGCFFCLRAYALRNRTGGIMPLTALKLFKNLSDETRLGIVLLLRELGELCVCDFCTALDESQPKISRHLAMLRESGLLLDRKQGKWVHYRLSPHIPSWAAQVIEQAWLSQQDDVQAIARKLASANCSGSGKAVCI